MLDNRGLFLAEPLPPVLVWGKEEQKSVGSSCDPPLNIHPFWQGAGPGALTLSLPDLVNHSVLEIEEGGGRVGQTHVHMPVIPLNPLLTVFPWFLAVHLVRPQLSHWQSEEQALAGGGGV